MAGEAEIEKKEKGFVAHLFTWVAVVFGLVAIYVLSFGPAIKVVWTPGGLKQTAALRMVVSFYAPVTWACDQSASFNSFITWYVEKVWRVPG